MKKVIIISIILAALLACGGALAIFIAAQDGGIPSESIPAENTPAENVLPADENISADDEVKPVKTTLTIEEVLAAAELAKKQYAENDPICEKLGITPDPAILQFIEDNDAYVEEHGEICSDDHMNMWYYNRDIYVLMTNIIFSSNLHEDMTCDFFWEYGGVDPFSGYAMCGAFYIIGDLNNGKYSSAEEYIVKTRPHFWSCWCGHDDVVTEIDTFLFCPSLGMIYYNPAGSIYDRSVEEHVAITNELIDNIIWYGDLSE